MKKFIYGGRFQPFHLGHYNVYKWVKQNYGDVILCSSDKTGTNSPFNFEQKKYIIKSLFGLDLNYSISPVFNAKEFLNENDIYITIIGQKDVNRMKSEIYEEYTLNSNIPYPNKIYYIVAPNMCDNLSATEIRNNLTKESFIKYYKTWNEEIFNMFNKIIK